MRVHVVSDVHARADALAKAGDGADALICLGDLVLFLDYDDPGGGIFADMFGADAAQRLIRLRTERRVGEARGLSPRPWARGRRPPRGGVAEATRGGDAHPFPPPPTPPHATHRHRDAPARHPAYVPG